MARHTLSLQMSQIIASDAPLLSPATDWDSYGSPTSDTFPFGLYHIAPSPPSSEDSTVIDSPVPATHMLKMHTESQQLCLPTHQVFDFPEAQNDAPVKRSASSAPADLAAKKPRADLEGAEQERLAAQELVSRSKSARSSKDFIPPDVSGLSKREARLVKNRAAAFLSRQRKREEFELMEVRVAELEEENARLLSMAMNTSSRPHDDLVSEIERLRAQLAAAEERERVLKATLEKKSSSVKSEPAPAILSLPSTTRSQFKSSGASLGLMVLLCALPALLSMPTHSRPATHFSFPLNTTVSAPSPAFDFGSITLPAPNDYEWSRNAVAMPDTNMDIDEDSFVSSSAPISETNKMEIVDGLDLGSLDVSFEASPWKDGRKIRVKIHNPAADDISRPDSPSCSSDSELDMWRSGTSLSPVFDAGFDSDFSATSKDAPRFGQQAYAAGDPFLGVGANPNENGIFDYGISDSLLMQPDFAQPDYAIFDGSSDGGYQRRVRIALKGAPVPGGEGGEWEVQLC